MKHHTPDSPQRKSTGSAEPLSDFEKHVADHSFRGRLLRWLTNWRIVVLILVAVLGVTWLLFGPRLYRSAKAWRAQHFLAAAQQARAGGDLAGAAAAFRKAATMAPYDSRVIRAVTYFRAEQGDPTAFPALKQLVDAGQATVDEILLYTYGMLWSGQADDARKTLARLPGMLTESQANRRALLEIELLAAQGSLDAAIELAQKRSGSVSGEAADDLHLAQARLLLRAAEAGSNAKAGSDAAELLRAVSAANTRSGIEALRLLATLTLKAKSTGGESGIPAKLRAHPLRTPDDLLLAASVEIGERPGDAAAIIGALREARVAAPDEEQLAFARWLNRRGAFEESLTFAGEERTRTDDEWLLVALDALAGMGRWEEVRQRVEGAGAGVLSEPIRYLFLARASLELGDTAAAEQYWLDVHRHSRLGKPEDVAYVARYAEQIGARAEAAKAYRRLSERKETALNGFLGLLRCLPRNTPAAEMLPIYRDFLQQYPHLAEVKNDEAYLSLLCKQDTARAAAVARQLHEKYPAMLSFLTTAVLGELRAGDARKAEALYTGQRIDWTNAPAPFIAVRVACLNANGQQVEAEALRKALQESALRPEERELLNPAATLQAPPAAEPSATAEPPVAP